MEGDKFLSTQGYYENNVKIWDFDSFEVESSLQSNSGRILYAALSPDGSCLVTGQDSLLKFWKVFEGKKE